MTPWLVVGPVLVAIVIAGAVMAVLFIVQTREPAWTRITSRRAVVDVAREDGAALSLGQTAFLASRIDAALEALGLEWPSGYRLAVRAQERWANATGVVVAGETNPQRKVLLVGPSLAALAHELVHAHELETRGVTDVTHTSPEWTGPGGWYERLAQYEAHLADSWSP
ncbi:MAG: hypothetical protein SFW67_35505 [Myxococcaceae bacterium]|nr:hypothetical protein [Myxococcaceae bacterium]